MGTKNNPGQFDCYAHAAPDEPMFHLLGRDKHAFGLVQLWALLRRMDGEDEQKVKEAFICSRDMHRYAANLGKGLNTPGCRMMGAILDMVQSAIEARLVTSIARDNGI